jgi:sugar lactone lactonase YvrE
MKRTLAVIGSILVLAVLYLLLWPVPIDPVAWDAPADKGLVDPFGLDDRLKRAAAIDLGEHHGPEDVTAGHDGQLYATTSDGLILRIDGDGNVSEFANIRGRALGIETDTDGSFVVANAYLGLQRIHPDGHVETLLSEVDGRPLMYANDLAIADNGTIYFSEASTKFGAKQSGGTYEGALLDITEHSDDQAYLLISDLGSYRILKHWLQGPKSGATEVLLDNLPAFADNINNGRNGRFWVGLISPRNKLLDDLSDKPFIRKIIQRLPASLRPKAEPYSHVIAINGNGEILMNLQDPAAKYPSLTGVFETADTLYLTTLFGNKLPLLDKSDL